MGRRHRAATARSEHQRLSVELRFFKRSRKHTSGCRQRSSLNWAAPCSPRGLRGGAGAFFFSAVLSIRSAVQSEHLAIAVFALIASDRSRRARRQPVVLRQVEQSQVICRIDRFATSSSGPRASPNTWKIGPSPISAEQPGGAPNGGSPIQNVRGRVKLTKNHVPGICFRDAASNLRFGA